MAAKKPWTAGKQPWTAGKRPWTAAEQPWAAAEQPWTVAEQLWTAAEQLATGQLGQIIFLNKSTKTFFGTIKKKLFAKENTIICIFFFFSHKIQIVTHWIPLS